LVEQLIRNQQVTGSSPVNGSNRNRVEAIGNSGFFRFWLLIANRLL
jgi:hypothetical protein